MHPSSFLGLATTVLASIGYASPIAVPAADLADPPVLNAREGIADSPVLNARAAKVDTPLLSVREGIADPPVLNA